MPILAVPVSRRGPDPCASDPEPPASASPLAVVALLAVRRRGGGASGPGGHELQPVLVLGQQSRRPRLPGRQPDQSVPRRQGALPAGGLRSADRVVGVEVAAHGRLRLLRARRPGAARLPLRLPTRAMTAATPAPRGARTSRWGYATAQSVVNGWLGSAGHKANIENPGFSSTGVGVAANGSGQLYWTQNFGNDVSGSTPPAPTPPAPTPPAPTPPAPTPPHRHRPHPHRPHPHRRHPHRPLVRRPPRSPPRSTAPANVTTPTLSASALSIGAKPARVTRQSKRARLTASVAFVQLTTGRPLATGSVRCRAEVGGKRLRVLTNAFKAQAARCAWRIPTWAKGKQLTGVVAVQVGDTAALRLFVRTRQVEPRRCRGEAAALTPTPRDLPLPRGRLLRGRLLRGRLLRGRLLGSGLPGGGLLRGGLQEPPSQARRP